MKWFIVVLLALFCYAFSGIKHASNPIALKHDTVPTGAVPQLFGGKLYEFRNYALVDSFLMVMGGDTFAIPRWPALKYKNSDNRWYGYHGTRWRAFLNGTDTISLSNRIDKARTELEGIVYNKTTWANLADFTIRGSPSPTIASGSIAFSGGINDFSKTIDLDTTTRERYVIHIEEKVGPISSTSDGLGIGTRSINSVINYGVSAILITNNTPNSGKLLLFDVQGSSVIATSSTALTFSAGDTLALEMERDRLQITLRAWNKTTGSAAITLIYTYSLEEGTLHVLPNAGTFSVFNVGGANLMTALTVTSKEAINSRLCLAGDSKLWYYAGTPSLGMLLDNVFRPTAIHAGPGDALDEMLAAEDDLLSITPVSVAITCGSNDISRGFSVSQTFTKYKQYVRRLTDIGTNVFHLLPLYQPTIVAQLDSLSDSIRAYYPAANVIDCRTAIRECPSCYLASDNVHLNKAAQVLLYNTIINSGKLSAYYHQAITEDELSSDSVFSTYVAYVDTLGNNATAVVNNPAKPFATINAALDATASFPKRLIELGVGSFTAPDSAKIKSYTWFRGSGKPKPNWTVAVPTVDGDTKTAPTKLIGGTILQGSFWFNSYRLQGIIISDLGVDVGSDWCTANNSGNPAEGLLFATAYTPGGGNAADGGHFLQSGTTPLQGLVVRNVAALCQSASAAVHAALFENCFAPDIIGVSTYFGTHGIVFKCIGGTASNLQAFGHSNNGIIIKSNDYANCYRLSVSNFTIGSIGTYDGGGLLLDANDAGSPGLYFCNITSGTINRTTYGIRTQGSVIDGNNISNIEVNVAQGNGVDILSGFAFGSLQNIKARTCGGHGFNIASTQDGITINDCDAHDNVGDGFRFTNSDNVNFDNINAILNDGYGINVVSGSVYGGVRYTADNITGAITGTIISKIAPSLQQVTSVGSTTADAISITGYSTTANKFRVGDFALQPYGLNNGFVTDNAQFNGSAWARFNTGYASKIHFYNGQVMLSAANTGSGAPTWMQGLKTDFNGHVGLGGNIDDVTFSGSKVYVDGSTGRMGIGTTSPNYLLDVNGKAAIRTIDSGGVAINMLYQDPATGEIFKAAVPAGASYTFTNGLTEFGGTAKLGGSLTENTQISTGGFTTVWTGANDGETLFSVTNIGTTGANAFAGNASTGTGVTGTSTSGIGVIGSSSSNYGLLGTSTSGQAIRGQINPASTNTIANAMSLLVTTSGGAGANGLGAALQFELETATSGNSQSAGSIVFKWTDATNGTQTSQYEINGVNSGTTTRKAALAGNGQWTWDGYGSGVLTVTPATTPVYSATGIIGERIAPKIYTALLSQSSTSAPTSIVLGTNEIGSIVWTRNSTGNYTGTLSGAFTTDKTWLIVQRGDQNGSFINGILSWTSANALLLTTNDNAGNPADGFSNMSIEIRVYP